MKVLKKIWRGTCSCARILATAFFAIFPRSRRLIIFGAWAGMRYDDNSRVLFEYFLEHHKEYRCLWMTRNAGDYESLKKQGRPVCRIRSLKGFWAVCRCRAIVCTDTYKDYGWRFCAGGAIRVNLWHGVGPKRIGTDVRGPMTPFGLFEKRMLDHLSPLYLMSTSPAITERFSRTLVVDPGHMRNLGQARNDYFYTPHLNSVKDCLLELPAILYMPTFREGPDKSRLAMNLEEIMDLHALDELCDKYGFVFLVKFHQWTKGHVDTDKYSHIIQVGGMEKVPELLDAADVLVTDYSSAFVDHLLLDRPQIFYAYDLDHYKSLERDLYGDYINDATGPVCRDWETFIKELERILAGEDLYAEKRHAIRDFYYSPENQCIVAPKQAEFIISLLK